jgi:hypothetical protein
MITKDEVLKIGKLQKPYGIKGEISLVFDKPVYAGIDTEFYFLDIDRIFVPFLIEEITFITDTGARTMKQRLPGLQTYTFSYFANRYLKIWTKRIRIGTFL